MLHLGFWTAQIPCYSLSVLQLPSVSPGIWGDTPAVPLLLSWSCFPSGSNCQKFITTGPAHPTHKSVYVVYPLLLRAFLNLTGVSPFPSGNRSDVACPSHPFLSVCLLLLMIQLLILMDISLSTVGMLSATPISYLPCRLPSGILLFSASFRVPLHLPLQLMITAFQVKANCANSMLLFLLIAL